jgi:hypothetical protein
MELVVLIIKQAEDRRESSAVGKASQNGNRGIHHRNQILLGFGGNRETFNRYQRFKGLAQQVSNVSYHL